MSSKRDEHGPFSNAHFRVEIDQLPASAALEVVLPEARIVASAASLEVHYGNLTLRRGLTLSSAWYQWWDGARTSPASHRKTVVVVLLDPSGAPMNRFMFRDALPTAYAVSPLNALGDSILIETLELSVGGFEATFGSSTTR